MANLCDVYSIESLKAVIGTYEVYDRAIDVETAEYTYEETTEKIVKHEELQKESKID